MNFYTRDAYQNPRIKKKEKKMDGIRGDFSICYKEYNY
jgi:hypothetical protein